METLINHCKYATIDSIIVYEMVDILYNVLEKPTGGLAHIIADENNLDDESLNLIIKDCDKEENLNTHEANICKILCNALLRLTYIQRCFVFAFIENYNGDISLLKQLSSDLCCLPSPGVCCYLCNFKDALNKFYAEQECIKETGSNQNYIDGNWHVDDIID